MTQKIRDILLLVAQITTLACAVVVISRAGALQQLSYNAPDVIAPIQPAFDEKQLTEIIQKQLPLLQPKAGADGANGQDGANGIHGTNGKDATVDYEAIRTMVKDEVAKIPAPLNGKDALSPPAIEFNPNPSPGVIEWRYAGDDSWQVALNLCTVLGSCNGQATGQ